MASRLIDKVFDCLTNSPNQKFKANEIASWIYENYPDECKEKQQRAKVQFATPAAFKQQLAAEIGASRSYIEKLGIKTTTHRPRLYYFSTENDSVEIKHAEDNISVNINNTKNTTLKGEHALYPLLADYLAQEFGLYSMRIDEKRSSNKRGTNGNKWLYPDLVAMEDLSQDWHLEIKNCVKEYFDKKTRLWSFEVKVLINSSNVREVFFQAVSNSSWANFGYLVASEVIDTTTLKEIRILSSLHGIGLILLNTGENNDSESQILIPAREKTEIDWNNANRLAEENKDFLDYIKHVRHFYQTGNINERDWLILTNYTD